MCLKRHRKLWPANRQRQDETAIDSQLLPPYGCNIPSTNGQDNAVKRRAIRKSLSAICADDLNIALVP
jgi:hypothetical protein